MPERLNAGHLLVIAGAAALLVSLFLDWYEPGLSAWEVFEIGDIVLAALAIVALVIALPMRLPGSGASLASERALPWIGVGALAFVIVTLLDDPPAARDLPLESGAWLGFVGAALMAAGGFLTKSQISIVVSSRPASGSTAGSSPSEPAAVSGSSPTTGPPAGSPHSPPATVPPSPPAGAAPPPTPADAPPPHPSDRVGGDEDTATRPLDPDEPATQPLDSNETSPRP